MRIFALKVFLAVSLITLVLISAKPPLEMHVPSYRFTPLSSPNLLNVTRNDILSTLNGPNQTLFMIIRGHGTLYLTNEVYGAYIGGTWFPVKSSWAPVESSLNASEKSITIVSLRQIVGNLPVPSDANGVSIPCYYSNETGLFRTVQPVVVYTVFYGRKKEVGPLMPCYLTVKPKGGATILDKMKSLAVNITRGASTSYQKVQMIAEYLRSHYFYGNSYVPPGVDPVYYFLFVSHTGICVDFNAAFVVLSRLLGIPARLVTGYLVLPGQREVTSKNAHAWAQVYIKGRGWVRVDATGSQRPVHPVKPGEKVVLSNVLEEKGIQAKTVIRPRSKGIYIFPVLLSNNSIGARTVIVGVERVPPIKAPMEVKPRETFRLFNRTYHAPDKPGIYYVNVTLNGTHISLPVVVGRNASVRLINVSISRDVLIVLGKVTGALKGSAAIVMDRKTLKRVPVRNGTFSATVNVSRMGISGGMHYLYAMFYEPGYLPAKSNRVGVKIVSRPLISMALPGIVRAGRIEITGAVTDAGGRPAPGNVTIYIDGRRVATLELTNGDFKTWVQIHPGHHVVTVEYGGSEYITRGKLSRYIDATEITSIKFEKHGKYAIISAELNGTDSIEAITSEGTTYLHGHNIRLSLRLQPLLQAVFIKNGTVLWYGSFRLGTPKIGSPAGKGKVHIDEASFKESLGMTRSTPSGEHKFTQIVLVMAVIIALLAFMTVFPRKKEKGRERKHSKEPITLERSIFAAGEEVTIKTNDKGPIIVDGREVGWGPEVRIRPRTGEHVVEFKGAKRRFRVLPPEEAIVELYWKFTEQLPLRGVDAKILTPKEIEDKLKDKVGEGDINLITRIFETVRYGRKKIDMKEFLVFLKSLKDVTERLEG